MRRLVAVLVASIWVVALSAAVAGAQGVDDASLVGRVADATGGVLPGAIVTLSGPSLIGGARRAAAAADGSFRFVALSPGRYAVSAELAGFRPTTQEGIRLRAGVTLTVDLVLVPGAVTEVLQVRGHSPLVDVKSAAVPAHFDEQALQTLPTSRSLPSIINLVPGIAGDAAFGGAQASNGMYVDGVDATDPHFQDASLGFNYNWVQEVQVVGLGASAEHGEFTGVASRSVLRSGGNRFSRLGEFLTSPPAWVSNNTRSLSASVAAPFHSLELLQDWELSLQAGGPIRRDRVWFFAGFQWITYEQRPAGYRWDGSMRMTYPRGIAKLSAAPAARVRLEGFVQRGVDTTTGDGIDTTTPIEAAGDSRTPHTSWNARLTWTPGANTLVDVRAGGLSSTYVLNPHAPNTRSGPPPHYDLTTDLYSGNLWQFYEWGGSRQTLALSVTHHADGFAGSHDLKFGAEFERAHSLDRWGTPGGISYMDDDGAPYLATIGGDDSVRSSTPRRAIYAQDEWRATSRLTLTPGVRVAFNRATVPSGTQVFSTTPVSPRVGLAWDLRADHQSVVRFHFGRYYDPTFSSRLGASEPGVDSTSTLVEVIGPGQFETIAVYPPVTNYGINPAIKHWYVDQYVAGFEQQLRPDLSVQVQYIRRNFDRFMGMIDTGTLWTAMLRPDTGPDGVAGTADDGGMLTVYKKANPGNEYYLYTNPEGAFRRYSAVQVIGNRRLADGWQLQAAYTWSRAVGTVTNHWHTNAARYDLGNPGTWVNPNAQINAHGHAPFDFTHEVKILGSYRVPLWGGFLASGIYRWHTGYAWGRSARRTTFEPGTLPVRVETVGTRRTPAINRLDLRVEKTFTFAKHGIVGLFLDVLNTANQGVPDAETVNPVVYVSGPTFGQPQAWVDPRVWRLGVRFTF